MPVEFMIRISYTLPRGIEESQFAYSQTQLESIRDELRRDPFVKDWTEETIHETYTLEEFVGDVAKEWNGD